MNTAERQQSFALEGLDGAGKTTLIPKLREDLEAVGLRVTVVSSPGKTWSGRILKGCMAKIDQSRKNILFTYDIRRTGRTISHSTDVVLWDRHLDSVVVSNGDGAEEEVKVLSAGIDQPNAIIFLDISPEISWERESKNSDHPLDIEWLRSKHRRYSELLKTDERREQRRFVVVDGTKSLDDVHQGVKEYLINELSPLIERKKEMYALLLETPGVVKFLLDSPFEVKPNVFLPMFVNFKNTWSKPEVRSTIVANLAKYVDDDIDWIVGLESGGSYYAVALANQLGKPVSLLRKGVKEHGDKNFMVGEVPPAGSKVLLVDDVYATGQSASRAVARLKEISSQCRLLTIFSYSSDKEIQDRLGIPGTALTYFKGLRHAAKERGLLDDDQVAELTRHVNIYRNTRYE